VLPAVLPTPRRVFQLLVVVVDESIGNQ